MSQDGYDYAEGAPKSSYPELPAGFSRFRHPIWRRSPEEMVAEQIAQLEREQNRNPIPGLGFGMAQPVHTPQLQLGARAPQQPGIAPNPTTVMQGFSVSADSSYQMPTIEHDDNDEDEGAIGDNELEEGELSEGEVEEDDDDLYNTPGQGLPSKSLNPTQPDKSNTRAAYYDAPSARASATYTTDSDLGPVAMPASNATLAGASVPSQPGAKVPSQARAPGNYQFTPHSSSSSSSPAYLGTFPRVDARQPSKAQPVSVASARKQAMDAMVDLRPLNLRIADYVKQGIDREVAIDLFETLGYDIDEATRSPSSTDMSLDVISDTPISETNNRPSAPPPGPSMPVPTIQPGDAPKVFSLPPPFRIEDLEPPPWEPMAPYVYKAPPPPKPFVTPEALAAAHEAIMAPPAEERKDRIARLLAAKGSKQTATQTHIPATTKQVSQTEAPKVDDGASSSLHTSAPAKPLSEKSKLLQQKMEALKKSREMQAQKPIQPNDESSGMASSPVPTSQMPDPISGPQVKRPTLQKSVSMPPSSPMPKVQVSAGSKPAAAASKRPAASDLNDLSDIMAKRPFGQARKPQPFLIDVSDDEEDAAMELDSPELEATSLHRPSSPFKIPSLHSFSATASGVIPRQFSSPLARATPSAVMGSGPSKNNLESINREIELMKLQITKAEARKKARDSGTGSPSGQPSSENTGESSPKINPPAKAIRELLPVTLTPSDSSFLGSPAQKLPKLSELRNASGPVQSRSRAASERLPIIEAYRKEQLLKLEALRSQVAKMEKEIAESMQEEEALRLEALEGESNSHGDEAERMPDDANSQGAAPMETDSESSSGRGEAKSSIYEPTVKDVAFSTEPANRDGSAGTQPSGILDAIAANLEGAPTNDQEPGPQAQSIPAEDLAEDDAEGGSVAMPQDDAAEGSEGSEPIEADSDSSENASDSPSRPGTADGETQVTDNKRVEMTTATPVTNPISIGQRESPAAFTREQDQSIPTVTKPKPDNGDFVPYDSPLQYFHAYRFHPQYQDSVSGGLRSLTYSHKIDVTQQLCPDQLAGSFCPRGNECDFQHFEALQIPDDQILVQLGAYEGDRRQEFIDGLKKLLTDFRNRKIKDFKTISQGIIDYRTQFSGDKTKILPLGNVSL